jgi:hypothetical protein
LTEPFERAIPTRRDGVEEGTCLVDARSNGSVMVEEPEPQARATKSRKGR